jgi:hypothetical protein
MRRTIWLAAALAAISLAAWRASPMFSGDSLLAAVPGRPLVAIHAQNLGDLARRVEALPAAQAYLKSKARDAYADSKLALKLSDRAERLSALAGMPLTLEALLDAAKGETTLALYDIGELQFLALTRLPAAEQAKLAFIADRARFAQRVYDGRTYFAKVDGESGLAFLFYQQDDLLIVASSPDLIEGTLLALAKPDAGARLAADPDWPKLLALDPDLPGADAVMFLDLGRLTRDRYFKAYWAWKNVADFEAIGAALVGFSCDGRSLRERRALLGPTPAAPPPALTYEGEGMAAFAAGGDGTTAQLQRSLGLDFSAASLDGRVSARLLVAAPEADATTGLIEAHAGAALAGADLDAVRTLEAAAEKLRAARPALRSKFVVQSTADGAALAASPGLPSVYAKRQGDLLLIADDPAFLTKLASQVKQGAPGPLQASQVDGAALKRLAEFLRQADGLSAFSGDGAEFAGGALVDILRSGGSFAKMRSATRPAAGGLLQETEWR